MAGWPRNRQAGDDLVVIAEFRDTIYPGLVSTGTVTRGSDRPFHTVINAENVHALQVLLYTHEGKVDVIYINPPYNTGALDWKYNNDYVEAGDACRHSKWLAFMERRLRTARPRLNPGGSVLIVATDEREVHRLALLLEQVVEVAEIQTGGRYSGRRQGVRAPGRTPDPGGLVSNTRALPRSQRSSFCTISSRACLRKAHSQTIATRQPACSRSCSLRPSRSVFASNLACQNSGRVAGVVAYGQPACRCQKQPCTKHTAPKRRNTRSGVPGRRRSCRRYRSPLAWMARRSMSSGRVSLLPIPAIMRERVARSTMSAIVVPGRPPEEHHEQQTTREVSGADRPAWFSPATRDAVGWVYRVAGSARCLGAISPFECDP